MKRILIINPFGIGDVLFSTPLISVLKGEYNGCYIGYICNIRTEEVLTTNPGIDKVFVFERDEYRALWKKSKLGCLKKLYNFWKEIKKRRFGLLLDLSLGREYAFLCWLIGIKERRGFDYKGRGRFLTHKIRFEGFNERPVAEYYLDLFRDIPRLRSGQAGQGTRGKESIGTLLVTTDKDKECIDNFLKGQGIKEGDVLVGVAPGGGASYGEEKSHYKRWGCEKFALLSDRIVSYGAKPILLGGPKEKKLIKDVELRIQSKPLIGPDTKIREMAYLIKRCRAFVCNDGGLLHIAVSQDTPTVSIFGPTDEKVYGPYPASEKHIVVTNDVDCRPCYRRFRLPECTDRKCMEGLSVDVVFNALSKFT